MGRPKKTHPGGPRPHRGRDRVWWGKWWDLGPAGSAEAAAELARLTALWVADPAAVPLPRGEYLVAELCADYLESADCPTGDRQRARVVTAVGLLLDHHGPRPAAAFGPVDLRAWQRHLCTLPDPKRRPGRTRFNVTSVRDLVGVVRRVWAWGVSTGRLKVELYQALLTVPRPKAGEARRARTVRPARPAHVKATLPFLRGPVRAMVLLEVHTGARPGELCRMRAGDVLRAGVFEPEDGEAIDLDKERVWVYAPGQHKLAWKGLGRALVFAGNARDVLAPFLERAPAAYCFSPRDTLAELRAGQAAERAKRHGGSGGNRKPPAATPTRAPSDHYTPRTYRQAVARACERAGVPHWYPYQLRHLAGADIKALFGIDAVQATLGHHTRSMAEHYGGRSLRTAAKVARERGGDTAAS